MDNLWGITPEQLLGTPTIHVPINMIVQRVDDTKVWGVWQCQHENGQKLLWDSQKTHQLILGDCFLRPHLVCDSNEFRGSGVSNLATTAFQETEKWTPIFHRS
jgi:hypothetical protein|tara:strand:+ start:2122 stop:2430 length:309 start_codon:yes stop_codon:yes gene_type:complete